jgi:hypothetical protein
VKINKTVSYILIIVGFIINAIAIVLLAIPFIRQNSDPNLSNTGIAIFFLAAILLGIGFYTLIQNNDSNNK